jgi:hypothetical protein
MRTGLPRFNEWTPVDAPAAEALTTLTNSPGVVYPLDTKALPAPLKQMHDASSYYISGYILGMPVQHGFTAIGEAVIARVDGEMTKNDNYLVATNSLGQVFVHGPHKGPYHHVTSDQSVEVSSLFNQNPLFKADGDSSSSARKRER